MKYNIKNSREARAFNIIYDYIDDMMPKDFRVDFSEDNDRSENRTPKTDSIKVYEEGGGYMLLFSIYLPNYWNNRSDLVEQSPMISFYNVYSKKFDTMFGKLWYEPFKMWIRHNIPEISDIDIKTFGNNF